MKNMILLPLIIGMSCNAMEENSAKVGGSSSVYRVVEKQDGLTITVECLLGSRVDVVKFYPSSLMPILLRMKQEKTVNSHIDQVPKGGAFSSVYRIEAEGSGIKIEMEWSLEVSEIFEKCYLKKLIGLGLESLLKNYDRKIKENNE